MIELYQQLIRTKTFFLIAGPCVVENSDVMYEVAETLSQLCFERDIPYVFKASYSKANRTSNSSFCGYGLEIGLELLLKIKSKYNLPLLTDVHETIEVPLIATAIDIIQIPAFLSRQTALIHAAAKTGKIINIKKGQFMAPSDMFLAAEKVVSQGNDKVLLTERGTTFGYHDLVVDFRGFATLKETGHPVVYDVTHSLQRPSIGNVSGGNPELAGMMACAAIATGKVNGLFIETHPEPKQALSDAASMIPLRQIEQILDACLKIWQALEH